MFKKLIFSFIFSITAILSFSTNIFASTTTFTNTQAYSNFYYLFSDTIEINQDANIFTLDIPKNDYTVYELGGVRSAIIFYTNNDGTGTNEYVYLDDLDDTLSVNKLYSVQLSTLSITPLSAKLLLMHNQGSVLPSGYAAFMAAETEYSFEAPNTVYYYSEGQIYFSAYFINNVPRPTDPTLLGFTFQYWKDINGNVYDFQLPPTEDQLNSNNEFYLEAVFFKDFTITPPSQLPPGVDEPLDIILFNTGFFNTPGFVLIYFILTILLNIGLWRLGSTTIPTLIGNITLTSLFMFLGYLPIYISALMIVLFITIVITQGKGGMFNE